jgi:class 3 adenylate cyclase
MKRKIAAIFAADIAGYSRLVAEDEEETLRRLAAYRGVTDDFIVKAGGRIFNTAGDAVLAEFPSAVEAVRCAIDIQESLRTRNMAYPPSRQMSFRIGITIGDVVERDGDLLGDGVNIAARLEGLAEVGGICVSRAVHEQVANKLSVQFADIGAQEVKNIPTPVHAYMIAMRREDGTYSMPQVKKPLVKPTASGPSWIWPVVIGVVSVVAICVAGFLYFTKLELGPNGKEAAATSIAAAPAPQASAAPNPAPSPKPAASAAPPPAPSPIPAGEKFSPDNVPLVTDRVRLNLANEYVPGADYKAFAVNSIGVPGFVVGQASEEAAKNAALDLCQKRTENGSGRRCELYAVGNTVVYPHDRLPMPPKPWIRRDQSVERVFSTKELPLVRDLGKSRLDAAYVPGRAPRAIALGPTGQFTFFTNGESTDEVVRRALESCGGIAGVPCMIVAADDNFVVPVPTTMKPFGFFKATNNGVITQSERENVAHKLADASSGWSAVAVGTAGHAGVAVQAASEQAATTDARADCAKRDSGCRVVAIGPFAVAPNN